MKRRALIGAGLLVAVVACSDTSPPTTTTASEATVLPPIGTTSTTIAATTTGAATAVPWAAPALAASEAPPVLAEQWGQADNQETCAALAPNGGVAGATPRAATFSGGWAVAWDAPDGPGMASDGTFCEDCGRSAVGVAGAGVAADQGSVMAWPNLIEFDDGSLAGYGVEGSIDGVIDNATTAEADSPTLLAYLMIEGQECLYNVWSRRSETELLDVIGRLRFVEGLGAPGG